MKALLHKLVDKKSISPIRNRTPYPARRRVPGAPRGVDSFDPASGLLTVVGTEGADEIVVSRVAGGLSGYNDSIQVKLNGVVEMSQPLYRLVTATTYAYWVPNVKSLNIDARGGNDWHVENMTSLPSTINGGWGDDNLTGGTGKDTLFGWYGRDVLDGREGADVLVGGSGNDVLHGGWGGDADALWGRNGGPANDNDLLAVGEEDNDTLYGLDGDDYLNGNVGDDVLWGFTGSDTLVGGKGNDRLYGEGGADFLYGEDGNDCLFGGAGDGADTLNGGRGADRFLMPATRTTGTGYTFEDTIQDFAAEDARPTFLHGYTTTVTLSPTETVTYTAKNWTDADVLRTDAVLDVLHREARGTKLLEDSNGNDLVIVRHGSTNRGFNDGWVHMTDASLQFGDTTANDVNLRGYLLHEIGHNWQGAAFQSAANSYWSSFLAQSGWTSTDPKAPTKYTLSTNEGRGNRWYLNTATFASNYARTNENEDFAESFAAFFTQRAGWTFYNGGAGAAAIPAKMAIFSLWLTGI
ncbi:MAG: calcium-binding protein [Gemmataceae bacterium]